MRHDFILLQEMHLNTNRANKFLAKWKNAGFFSPGRNHSGGTLILNQGNNIDFQLIEQFEDALGHFNYIILKVKAQKFLIIVYATSGQSRDQENARKLLWESLIAKFEYLDSVEATIRLNSLDIGKCVWILNRKHLNDVLYNEQVAKLITDYNTKTVNSANKREEWDKLKHSIKIFSKIFSRSEAKSRCVAQYKLKKQLRNALKKAHFNIHMRKLCVELKFKLEQFEINRARGAAVRAKIKLRTLGEKCNSFFFHLEKAKTAKQVVTRIKHKNGNEKNTTEEIIKEFELFYKNLYRESKNSTVHQKRLLDRAKVNRISDCQQRALTQPITLMEAKSALQGMTNNKSPGPDGLTVEFYKTHFNVLGDAIVSMLNEVVSKNEIATSH